MNRKLGWLSVALVASCGSDPTQPPDVQVDPEVGIVAGAGTTSTFTTSEALTADGTVERIGITEGGHLLAVADGQVHELTGGVLVVRSLYVGSGDPEALGAVHGIAPRIGGGAWIAAENGLFGLDGLYTYKIPLLEEAGAVSAAFDASGPLAGLWVAAADGLYRRHTDKVEKLGVEGLAGAATQVAVTQNGKVAAAVIGAELVILEPKGDQIITDRPPLDAGAINAVAAGADTIYVGTAKGLFAYESGSNPPWTHYTLAAEGASGVAVSALSVDPSMSSVWARTASGLIRLSGTTLETYSFEAAGAMSLLAVDNFGDVWTADGSDLGRNSLGAGGMSATFSEDVLPWIEANCSKCHRNQTQNFEDYEVFAEVAEMALSRVRSGDMPRCEGGVRCPSGQALSPDDYAVLEQWIRDGTPE